MDHDGTPGRVLPRVVRGFLLLVGLAVFALGALVVFVPAVAAALPVAAIVTVFGSDYVVVAVVGVVAVIFAAGVLFLVAMRGVDEAEIPVVEAIESALQPGRAIDRTVAGGDAVTDARVERLAETAVRTLVRVEHCSRSTAERQVADGTWTTDEAAAALLSDRGDHDARAVSDGARVRRTVEAIERLEDRTRDRAARDGDGRREEAEPGVGGAAGRVETAAGATVNQSQPSSEGGREGVRTGGQ